MHREQRNQHFDCQRGREEAREQTDDETGAADQFQKHDEVGKNQSRLDAVLGEDIGSHGRGPNFELAHHMHQKHDADDDAHERRGNRHHRLVKSGEPRKDQFRPTSSHDVSLLVQRAATLAEPLLLTTPHNVSYSIRCAAALQDQLDSLGTSVPTSGTATPSIRQRPFSTRTRPSATSLSASG